MERPMMRRCLGLAVAAMLLSGCFGATNRTTRDERTAKLDAAEEKWYHYKFGDAVTLRFSLTTSGAVSAYVLKEADAEGFGRGEAMAGKALASVEHAKQGEAKVALAPGPYVVALRCDGPAPCTFRLLVEAGPQGG